MEPTIAAAERPSGAGTVPRSRRRMSLRGAARLAARIAVVASIVLELVTIAAHSIRGWLAPYSAIVASLNAAVEFAFLAIGLLLIERRRGRAVGPLLLVIGLIYAVAAPLDFYLSNVYSGVAAIRMPFGDIAALMISACGYPGSFALSGAILLFPDGRFLSPRWRLVLLLGLVTAVAGVAALTFGTLSFRPVYPMFHSPFGIPGFPRRDLENAADVASEVVRAAAIVCLLIRWRRGDRVLRAQTTWVLAAIGLTWVVSLAEFATRKERGWFEAWLGAAGELAFLLIPLAMGLAIIRFHLFDIDRLVSRTIAYASISGILAIGFVGASLGFSTILGSAGEGEAIATSVATLVVAASFSTVRRRAQAIVDRRFDRSRYDAARAVDALTDRLRGDADLDRVRGDVLGVLDSTLHPAHRTIWLRGAGQPPS